jgi:CheY-like chemotaxis protein
MAGKESLPILAMTANVFEEDRKECREAGIGRLQLYTTTKTEGPVLRSKLLLNECDF